MKPQLRCRSEEMAAYVFGSRPIVAVNTLPANEIELFEAMLKAYQIDVELVHLTSL